MAKTSRKLTLRSRRRVRIRKRISGEPERPRMSVFRSTRHIYAQIVDDRAGRTLVAASSLCKELPDLAEGVELSTKKALAWRVGALAAQRAREAGIDKVVFDRGGYLYHGRVQALAEGARAGGLSV